MPDAVWTAALTQATSEAEQRTIGAAAAAQGNTTMASKAWLPLARMGDTDAINSLVALLGESDVSQAATATEPDQAAALAEVAVAIGQAGDTGACGRRGPRHHRP